MVTRVPPSYENVVDNDSIFVVMSDQKPPAPGAEEVNVETNLDSFVIMRHIDNEEDFNSM